jgi:hypothetical protein
MTLPSTGLAASYRNDSTSYKENSASYWDSSVFYRDDCQLCPINIQTDSLSAFTSEEQKNSI